MLTRERIRELIEQHGLTDRDAERLPCTPQHANHQQRREDEAHERVCVDGLPELVGDAFAMDHLNL